MERLTHKRNNGIKEGYWSPNKKDELVTRLAQYEDTGLTPEEISQLQHKGNTNADKIRSMSNEGLTGFLLDFYYGRITFYPNGCPSAENIQRAREIESCSVTKIQNWCEDCIREWLSGKCNFPKHRYECLTEVEKNECERSNRI